MSDLPTPDDDIDPADAFARVPTPLPPPPAGEPPRARQSKRKKEPRAPTLEKVTVTAPPPPDDDGMDPLDAAEEIIGLMDQVFAVACMFRGYDKLTLPDGTLILSMVKPDEQAKVRTKKAVARLLKTAGASMSPGMGLAFTTFGCYGAPIIALEAARASIKKAET
jgi:hypothetical protein